MKLLLDEARAADVLRSAVPTLRKNLKRALRRLADDPSERNPQLDVKKLATDREGPTMYRLRVGDWRVAYTIEPNNIVVLRIFHRSEGYGWLADLD